MTGGAGAGRAARGVPRRGLGRAGHRRVRLGRRRAGLGLDRARDRARACPSPACRRRASSASGPATSSAHAAGARGRGGRRASCAPWAPTARPCYENVLVAGATLAGAEPWREKSGEGISLATGHRAAQLILEASGARAGSAVAATGRLRRLAIDDQHDLLGGLMRDSLDHCVKCTICETFCPVSNVTPLFPGPSTSARRPSASASPTRTRRTRRWTTARAAASARRCARRASTSPRSTRRRGPSCKPAHGLQAARPAHRAARPRRPAGTPAAPIANWTPAQPVRCGSSPTARWASTGRAAVPEFAGRTLQGWARKHTSPPAQRRVAYFHGCGANWYEPDMGADRPSSCSSTSAARSTCPAASRCCGLPLQSNGMFDAARALHAPDGGGAGADGAGRRRHRRHLDELHAHAQARGARDPRARGRPRPARREREHL